MEGARGGGGGEWGEGGGSGPEMLPIPPRVSRNAPECPRRPQNAPTSPGFRGNAKRTQTRNVARVSNAGEWARVLHTVRKPVPRRAHPTLGNVPRCSALFSAFEKRKTNPPSTCGLRTS